MPPTIRYTRNYRFSASHRLHLPQFSDEENQRMFGKCNNPHGHGHNYMLSITVEGPIDPQTGVVVDPRTLDSLVEREVLSAYDHTYLNYDVEDFRGIVATTENMATSIRRRLLSSWPAAFPKGVPSLANIRVQETKRNVVALPVIEGVV